MNRNGTSPPRISVAAIHPDARMEGIIREIVGSHKLVTMSGFYTDYQQYLDSIKSPENGGAQVVLVHERFGEKLSELSKPDSNLVVFSPVPFKGREQAKTLRKTLNVVSSMVNAGNISATINFGTTPENLLQKGDDKCAFRGAVNNLIENGRVVGKIKIGIAGMGILGHGIAREIVGKPWLRELTCYSAHEDSLRAGALASVSDDDTRVKRVGRFEGLLERKPDVLIIARGKKITDSEFFQRERGVIQDELFRDSYPLVDQCFSAVEKTNYHGLICVLSNAAEYHLSRGHDKFGIPANQLTSWSADLERAKHCLIDILAKDYPELGGVKPEEIDLNVIGFHGGGEIPILETCRIRGKLLRKIAPEIIKRGIELRSRIIQHSNDVMRSANDTGINPVDVSKAISVGLDSIAHYMTGSELPWYYPLNGRDIGYLTRRTGREISSSPMPFIMGPVRIGYEHGIRVERNGSESLRDFGLNNLRMLADFTVERQNRIREYGMGFTGETKTNQQGAQLALAF